MKPRHTAGPQFLMKSDMPGDPGGTVLSISHNASRGGSIPLADAAARAAAAFGTWRPGRPVEEWLMTADRVTAGRLYTYARSIETIDPKLAAEILGVVAEMKAFLKIPESSTCRTVTAITDVADDCSIRIGICSCTSGRSCELCLMEKGMTDAIIAQAAARRAAIEAQEQAREHQREERRQAIAEAREQRRRERRAALTVPTLSLHVPGEAQPVPVWLNRLEVVDEIEVAIGTLSGFVQCLALAQRPGCPEVHARLHSYEAQRLRRELVALGVVDDAG